MKTREQLEAENLKLRDQIGDLLGRLQHAVYIYEYMAGGARKRDVGWQLMADEAKDTIAQVVGMKGGTK